MSGRGAGTRLAAFVGIVAMAAAIALPAAAQEDPKAEEPTTTTTTLSEKPNPPEANPPETNPPETKDPQTKDPETKDPKENAGDPGAGATSINGFVGDDQNNALGGICVVFYANGVWDGFTMTGDDGYFSFTPAVGGSQQLAIFRPSKHGDCDSAPQTSGPVPEWLWDVKLSFSDPRTATPDQNAQFVGNPTNDLTICLGENELYNGGCSPKRRSGPGVVSGRVLQQGGAPVSKACIYVLPESQNGDGGFPAMTDGDGRFVVSGMPMSTKYVIGVIPPFDIGQGPCQFDDGPPPSSKAGALQPEWYGNAWIDLESPDIDEEDTFSFAVKAGAIPVTPDAAGLDVCLTTDAGTVAPRPTCEVAAAAANAAADPISGTLPLTGGRDLTVPTVLGTLVLLFGLGLVVLDRRRRPSPRRVA